MRKIQDFDPRLYLATDPAFIPCREPAAFVDILEPCLAQGCTVLQLRLKATPARVAYEIALRVRELTRRHQIPLILNDRVDLALAVEADGVHLGRSDMPLEAARRLMGGGIVGYSVNQPEHLQYAREAGADYVGAGPVFATGTKQDTGGVLGLSGLSALAERADMPVVAIGGINSVNAAEAIRAGANGVCVISAVLAAVDPGAAAAELRHHVDSASRIAG